MATILTVVNAGGHLTQALCIMRHVEDFHLVTSVDFQLNVGAQSVTVVKGTQFNPFIHLLNIFIAFRLILKIKPKAIFSTGGPICLPYAVAAKVLCKRFIYLDTLSRVQDLSNTARFLYKYKLASEIYCQWKNVADRYPGIEYHGKTFDICGENELKGSES